jgi:hypothetical protein
VVKRLVKWGKTFGNAVDRRLIVAVLECLAGISGFLAGFSEFWAGVSGREDQEILDWCLELCAR